MKNELAKFRKMNFSEKRWYIWEYYRLHIGGFILVLIIAASIFNIARNPAPQNFLYIAWVNTPVNAHMLADLQENLSVIVDDEQTVTIGDFAMQDNPQANSHLQTRFTAYLLIGAIDAVITTRDWADEAAEKEIIRDIYDVKIFLPDDFLHDRIFEYAISLEGSPLLTELGFDTHDLFLCMIANTHRFDAIAKALEVLFCDA
jgi:hypothetical protein